MRTASAWRRLSARDLPALSRFLAPRETYCSGFSGRLMEDGVLSLPHPAYGAVYAKLNGPVSSAISFHPSGLWFPVFGELPDGRDGESIRRFVHSGGITAFSCSGLEEDVVALESILAMQPLRSVRYFDLAMDTIPTASPAPPEGFSVRLAGPADFHALSPLQTAYELEEVVVSGTAYDPSVSAAALRRALATEIVVVAERDGRIEGKAQTNARGLAYDQVGGVFVTQSARNRGVGRSVVGALLGVIGRSGKRAALFVKRQNQAALAVYRTLGFRLIGDYRVDYFA